MGARGLKNKVSFQFALFVAVGGLTFLLDLATFAALSSAGLEVVLSNFVSISVSTIAGFFGHLFFTFSRRGVERFASTSVKFLAVAVLFGALNFGLSTLLILLVTGVIVQELGVKTGVILALAILRFAMMKRWVFV